MFKKYFPPFFGFIFIFGLLEILVRAEYLSSALVPSPTQVCLSFWQEKEIFAQAFFSSFENILAAWLLSIIGGASLALALSLSPFLKQAFLPFAIFFQTVPIIAIAPLLVIYLGFGAQTVIAAGFIVAIFPVIANTLIGLESVTPAQMDLFCLYKASRLKILFKLRLPAGYNYIYAGTKISAGLAVIGVVAGEFVAGGGLGALIDSARTQQRVDNVFVALVLLSLIGLILIALLKILNICLNLLRPWGLNLKD